VFYRFIALLIVVIIFGGCAEISVKRFEIPPLSSAKITETKFAKIANHLVGGNHSAAFTSVDNKQSLYIKGILKSGDFNIEKYTIDSFRNSLSSLNIIGNLNADKNRYEMRFSVDHYGLGAGTYYLKEQAYMAGNIQIFDRKTGKSVNLGGIGSGDLYKEYEDWDKNPAEAVVEFKKAVDSMLNQMFYQLTDQNLWENSL